MMVFIDFGEMIMTIYPVWQKVSGLASFSQIILSPWLQVTTTMGMTAILDP